VESDVQSAVDNLKFMALLSLLSVIFLFVVVPLLSFLISRKTRVTFLTAFVAIVSISWLLISLSLISVAVYRGSPLNLGALPLLLVPAGMAVFSIRKILRRGAPKVKSFSFSPGEQVRLRIEHLQNWSSAVLILDGNEIGRFTSKQELSRGKTFPIERGRSSLFIQRVSKYPFYGLRIDRDGAPLPGTFGYCERKVRGAATMLLWSSAAGFLISLIQMSDRGRVDPELAPVIQFAFLVQAIFLALDLVVGALVLLRRAYSLLRLAYKTTVAYMAITLFVYVAILAEVMPIIQDAGAAVGFLISMVFQVAVYLLVVLKTVLPHLRMGIEGAGELGGRS
jgi:hypothetical protein